VDQSRNFHHTVAPSNQQQAVYCYFAPVGDAKYVDEYVCVSVCLLVRERKWSSKMPQCCCAFTLALARLSCMLR